MSNFTNIITSEFKQLFIDAIDSLLDDNSLTIPCQLIFSNSKFTECTNCLLNNMTGKSSGQYKSGGPIPFSAGVCPRCHGIGRTTDEQTETLYFGVIWDSKQFLGKFPVGNPNEFVQTVSKKTSYDEIKRANQIIIDTGLTDYTKNRFERVSEPEFVEFGSSSYIFTTWKRVA